MDDSLPAVPALGLSRALFFLVLALLLGALIYSAWIVAAYSGRIGV